MRALNAHRAHKHKSTIQTMTVTKEEEPEIVVTAVPDASLPTAVGAEETKKADGGVGVAAGGRANEPPIPPGHSRYYCSKCRSVSENAVFRAPSIPFLSVIFLLHPCFYHVQPYDLPDGATTWRCMGCHTFNSTTPGECEWCSIL